MLTMSALRESVKEDANRLGEELAGLKEQVSALKEKDRLHLEEIKQCGANSRMLERR
jgi:hypothetical protein